MLFSVYLSGIMPQGRNRRNRRFRTHFVIARSAAAHGEPVEPRGNLDEAEHTSANRRCYGDEIANPRIEYGVVMTKWVRMR